MAADLIARMGLDDSEFERVSKKVDATAQRMSRNMEGFGKQAQKGLSRELVARFTTMDVAMRAATASIQFAADAMAQYQEQFPGMTTGIGEVTSAMDRLKLSIG